MLSLFVILLGLSVSHGKSIPYYDGIQHQLNSLLDNNYDIYQYPAINSRSVIKVPENCPPGKHFINGVCRDVWRINAVTQPSNIQHQNVITVPTNCPDGQELVNGVCRDIWRHSAVRNQYPAINSRSVIKVPENCPPGKHFINGVCRDVWRINAVTQPSNIQLKNVITVPTNCPDGQELVNGACRDIWRHSAVSDAEYSEVLAAQEKMRNVRQAEGEEITINIDDLSLNNVDRNIINVPNQCPAGYRPDANGVCREILD